MAYPKHWLLSFGGTLGGRDEWVCGIRMRLADGFFPPPAGVDEEAAMANYENVLGNWFISPSMNFTQQAILKFIKLNEIGPDGKYADKTQTHRRDLTTHWGGYSGSPRPLDQALCITFTTDAQRGKASKGRIYMPAAIFILTDAGTYTAADCQTMATATAQMLTGLAPSDVTGGLEPAVVSPGVRGDLEGGSRRITGVRIGDVPDRQRRRRENTPEVYKSAVVGT